MTGLELTGAAAIYIVCVFLLGYAGAILSIIINQKEGLGAFVLAPVIASMIWVVGAVCGVIWLGIKIGEMS